MTGLTIIADLACGAGIDLRAMPALSNDAEFQTAARQIVRSGCSGWAELILGTVRDTGPCKTEVLVRALLFGCKVLHAEGAAAGRSMQTEYAARLRVHYLDLEGATSNASLRQQIVHALSLFPEDIARKVMHPRFLR